MISSLALLAVALLSGAPTSPIQGTPGYLLDPTGEPIAGVRVVAAEGSFAAVSGADGSLGIVSPSESGARLVVDPGQEWATVRAGRVPAGQSERPIYVVAAPARRVTATFVGEDGDRLGRQSVDLWTEAEALFAFPHSLENTTGYLDPYLRTDELGSVAFDAPAFAGTTVRLPWVSGRCLSVDELRSEGGTFVMPPFEKAGREVAGCVHLPDVQASIGTLVKSSLNETRTDADGGFRFFLDAAYDCNGPRPLAVLFDGGWAPICVPDVDAAVAASETGELELVARDRALSISGHVVTESGAPLPEPFRVDLHDGFDTSPATMPKPLAEQLSGNRKSLEPVTTGPAGWFRIEGLRPGTYALDAWCCDFHPMMVRSEPIAAGTQDVVLRVPSRTRHPLLRGRILDASGRGIAGVDVQLELDLPLVFEGYHNSVFPQSAVSDDEGRFTMRNAARDHASLVLEGPPIAWTELPLPAEIEGELELVIPRRCDFRFVYAGAGPAPDSIAVLDENGAKLEIGTRTADWNTTDPRFELRAAETHVLTVPDTARTLLAYRADEVVGRVPFEPNPRQVVTVVLG